jgi:type II secretory pathway component PulK
MVQLTETKIVPARGRHGLMLFVVLVMIALLSLLAASYAFVVRANLSTAMANHERFQARMAMESGIQRVIVMLRKNVEDPEYTEDLNRWFDNPKEFQGGLVYGMEGKDKLVERREQDTTYDPNAKPAWRYNLVAPNYDEVGTVRYGITDECSKLDLNVATEARLRLLFESVIPQDQDNAVDIDMLADSLLDWRESGSAPRPKGAKNEYYQALDPPYRCKSGKFSSVEELLMVRGFTAWVVFGEDYNRNGLLDANEDDGDASFPPDNADGVLFPGVAPFLTVWSRELNVSNDHRPRINLNFSDKQKLQEMLGKEFDSNVVSYVMTVRGAGKTFSSVMNLLPAPPPPPQKEEGAEGEGASTTTQATGGRRSTTSQPRSGRSTSQPTSENAEGQGEGLTDLQQSDGTSEKRRTPKTPVYQNLTEEDPPGTLEMLPHLLDRLTVATLPAFTGRVNVSTAPPEVLATIEELSDAEIQAIMATRRELSGLEKATPAWLLTMGVLDEAKFRMLLDGKDLIEPQAGGIITTQSAVYSADAVGYADHLGVVERWNVVFEMRGPIAQVLYQRNLTGLGPAYNPHGVEQRGLGNRPE